MTVAPDPLSRLVYPGRWLAIGIDRTGEHHVVLYGITGRSASSQARKLELEGNAVWTKPTDPETLKKGNPELLVYPAFIFSRGLAVSNGRQTTDIDAEASSSPVTALDTGLGLWTYEPDAPIFTPRITGCILPSGRSALSIIKRGPDGEAVRVFYEIAPRQGKASLLTTYAGDNREPLQPFAGEPWEIDIAGTGSEESAGAAYAALGPQGRPADFRVAVACVFARRGNPSDYRLSIINRHERTPR